MYDPKPVADGWPRRVAVFIVLSLLALSCVSCGKKQETTSGQPILADLLVEARADLKAHRAEIELLKQEVAGMKKVNAVALDMIYREKVRQDIAVLLAGSVGIGSQPAGGLAATLHLLGSPPLVQQQQEEWARSLGLYDLLINAIRSAAPLSGKIGPAPGFEVPPAVGA